MAPGFLVLSAGLAGIVGLMVGGGVLVVSMITAALVTAFLARNTDRLTMAQANGVEVDDSSAPELASLVRTLAKRAGVAEPRLFMIEDAKPNAYSCSWRGRRAILAVTSSLMNFTSREELCGVLAHELAHIQNNDAAWKATAATILCGAAWAPQLKFVLSGGNPVWIGVAGLAAVAGAWLRDAIYRAIEYRADRTAAKICGKPAWIAAALQRLDGAPDPAHPSNGERIRRLTAGFA